MQSTNADPECDTEPTDAGFQYINQLTWPTGSRSNGLSARLLDSLEARQAEEVQLERLAVDFDDHRSARRGDAIARALIGRLRASMDLGMISWCRHVDLSDPSAMINWFPRANALWCVTCASELAARRRALEFAVCDMCLRATMGPTVWTWYPAGHLGMNVRLCRTCSDGSVASD